MLRRKIRTTPDSLRAMWAAIPGVCFDPPKPQQVSEPRTKTRTGRPRKYAIGHPGAKWYSTKQATELLQMKRVTFLRYARECDFVVEKRVLKNKKGSLMPASAFYLKSEIRNFHKQRKQHHENA